MYCIHYMCRKNCHRVCRRWTFDRFLEGTQQHHLIPTHPSTPAKKPCIYIIDQIPYFRQFFSSAAAFGMIDPLLRGSDKFRTIFARSLLSLRYNNRAALPILHGLPDQPSSAPLFPRTRVHKTEKENTSVCIVPNPKFGLAWPFRPV